MTTNPREKLGRYMLRYFVTLAILVAGFFGALLWFKPRNGTFVLVLSAAFAVLVMGYASFTARRVQRHLDEVQIASQGFASVRGYVWGALATTLLLMTPPVANWLIDLANTLTTGSPAMSNRSSVQVALFFGFMLVVLMQCGAMMVAAAIWQRRMGGERERQ